MSVTPGQSLQGVVVVDKPLGMSSMDAVFHVRRSASRAAGIKKTKCGHAGTLDPLATGVMICCLGKATKSVEKLMGLTKIYETQVDLSAFTETEDREGQRIEVAVETPPTLDAIEAACAQMVGEIEQIPPKFSAIHIGGRRAYDLAREGADIKMHPRIVRVDSIDVMGYDWPTVSLRIVCGKGTYIRSIGRDLGVALGTGGHLASLRRTAVGPYTVQNAWPMEHFEAPMTGEELLALPESF